MRFSQIILAMLAAAIAAAAPLSSAPGTIVSAGKVVTDKGVTYHMHRLDEIKAFDAKVDNGEYPYPLTYQVAAGFSCIFYLESTRGVGSPIGQFNGPAAGGFHSKVECYKCWVAESSEDSQATVPRTDPALEAIPCGFTRVANGGEHSLIETNPDATRLQDFTINGKLYVPVSYHVSKICTCRFWGEANGRGRELIDEEIGEANGDFDERIPIKYQCWMSR